MCGGNCSFFYRVRPIAIVLLSLGELYLLYYRINILFPYIFITSAWHNSVTLNYTMIENGSTPIRIAFILDVTSSITAAALGVFILSVIIIFLFCLIGYTILYYCIHECCIPIIKSCFGEDRSGLKALQRFLSLDCNCPCYRARPSLRFRLRFTFLLLCFGLRGGANYQYWSLSEKDSQILPIFHVCLLSLPLLIGTLLLDFYHYTVWWYYTPQIDTRCHCRSRKHQRYIPYHLVGEERRTNFVGDTPCTSDPCYNRHLSHVVIFHSRDYKPQPRWSTLDTSDNKGTYIGFHTTTPDVAVLIAHSEFRIGDRAGMLGKGVYFARSMQDTIGKANSTGGACIIAEIRMGKVYQCDKQSLFPHANNPHYEPDLYEFVRGSVWHDLYDTCYLNHDQESKDEFCIKDPVNQIIRWIIVIHDPYDAKVKQYGLDTEFDSTLCLCI